MKKLNLGCGNKYLDGFINCDISTKVKTDAQFDLEQPNWPFEDDSIDEIVAQHSLEHLSRAGYKNAWKEMYRICKHDAELLIHFPYHFSTTFFSDPTHQTPITLDGLVLLNKEANDHFIENNLSCSTLAYEWEVDFYIISQEFFPSPLIQPDLSRYPEKLVELGTFNVDVWESGKVALKCRKKYDKKEIKTKKHKTTKKAKS